MTDSRLPLAGADPTGPDSARARPARTGAAARRPDAGRARPGSAAADEPTPNGDRSDRLRILHLLAPAAFGGLEQVVQSLASEQSRAGHAVCAGIILDPGETEHPVATALERVGVRTRLMTPPARAYWQERRLVRELCIEFAPDIVHTHGYRTDVLHLPVARRLGIGTASTVHGFIGGDWKNRIYEKLQRRAFRRCGAVVAVSRAMVEGLAASGVPADRIHCVPNAWANSASFLERGEARRALGIREDERWVGFIGRIGHEKGPDVLIDALERLDGATNAVLIGDGRLRAELQTRTESSSLAGAVRWTGAVENAARLMKAFDAVVLSSRTEGTPIVLLEAMAAGVPVVATRVGGIPHVISEREAALVDSERPDALAEAIRSVLENPDAAAERAACAGERLRTEFSAARWLELYDDVYHASGAHAAGSR